MDVEVRPPYSWLMRWTSQPSEIEMATDVALLIAAD